jgi:hypothetical protein
MSQTTPRANRYGWEDEPLKLWLSLCKFVELGAAQSAFRSLVVRELVSFSALHISALQLHAAQLCAASNAYFLIRSTYMAGFAMQQATQFICTNSKSPEQSREICFM